MRKHLRGAYNFIIDSYKMNKKKIIIIGAGPAGLTAAYEFLDRFKNYEVVVLEESSKIGGISRMVNYKGNRMDIGGHRFLLRSPDVIKWWEKMMPTQGALPYDDRVLKRKSNIVEGGPDPEKTDKVMLRRNRLSRIFFNQKFFDYPVSLKVPTIKNMGLGTTFVVGCSYLKSVVHKRPEKTLEDFYINRFGKKLYSMFFEDYTENLWGRHPRDISPEYGKERVNDEISVFGIIASVFRRKKKDDTDEFAYPKLGPGQLWELTAKAVKKKGGEIIMNAKVVGVKKNSKDVLTGVVYEKDGKKVTLKGDYVISSMPIKDLVAAMNDVPSKYAKIAKGLPYRDYMTVGVLAHKLALKNETNIETISNIVPDNWVYVHDKSVQMGRIQIYNNWSPYLVKDIKSTVWVGLEYFCNEGDKLWSMSDDDFAKMAIKEMVKINVLDSEDGVIDYHVERVKKAYPAYFDTYEKIDNLRAYLDKIPNLFCVGRNGQHRYIDMDSAMLTAFEAVKGITEDGAKENIWGVNAATLRDDKKVLVSDNKNRHGGMDNAVLARWLKRLKILIALLIPVAVAMVVNSELDNDSWYVLAEGREIVNNGLYYTDQLTMHEGLGVAVQNYGFAVIFYLLYLAFGGVGLYIAMLILDVILCYLIYKICMVLSDKNLNLSLFLTILTGSLLATTGFVVTRAQMVSYIILILVIYILECYVKDGRTKKLCFIPLLSLLQINLHASLWPMIIAVLGVYIIDFRGHKIKPLIITLIVSLLAGLINPYGIKMLVPVIASYGVPEARDYINELRPFSLGANPYILLYLMIVVAMILYIFGKNKNKRIRYFLMIFGFLGLGINSVKGMSQLILTLLFPLAGIYKTTRIEKWGSRKIRWMAGTWLGILSLTTIISYVIMTVPNVNSEGPSMEMIAAMDELDKAVGGNDKKLLKIYSDYNEGGYVEFRGYKPYIDPRIEVAVKAANGKEDIFSEYFDLQSKGRNAKEFLEKYDFDYLIIREQDTLYKLPEDFEDKYELLYIDDDEPEDDDNDEKYGVKVYKKKAETEVYIKI